MSAGMAGSAAWGPTQAVIAVVTALAVGCMTVPLGASAAPNPTPSSTLSTDSAGVEAIGDSGWLASATGNQTVFIQTTGEEALQTRNRAANNGLSTAAVTAATATRVAAIKSTTSRVDTAVSALDPQAIKLYDSQYTVPGVAVTADATTLRTIAKRSDVLSITEIPEVHLAPDPTTDTSDTASPQNATSAALLKAINAWTQTNETGTGVKVAVADTGVDYTHADFGGPGTTAAYNTALSNAANTPNSSWYNSSKYGGGVDLAGADANHPQEDNNPIPGAGQGHGTHVAGSILGYGVKNNARYSGSYSSLTASDVQSWNIGPGMAPNAKVYPIKIFGDDGSGTSLGGKALEWVAAQYASGNKIDIVNMSIGSDYGAVDSAYDNQAIEQLNKLGIVVVIAAGNAGDLTDISGYPGGAERALTVAASDSSDRIAYFSSRGAHGSYGGKVKPDVSAPGYGIISAALGTGFGSANMSGTSMATPITAGVTALLVGAHQTWQDTDTDAGANRIKAAVMSTANADLADSTGKFYSLTRTGTGRVNALAAVQSNVWMRSEDSPDLVTVSFGVIEVSKPLTQTRTISVHNDGTAAQTFTTKYWDHTTMPGVSYSVTPATVTIPAGGQTNLTVALSIPDPSALRKVMDPTQTATQQSLSRQFVADSSGVVQLTPASTSEATIRLGVYAAPKLASTMSAATPVFDQADVTSGYLPLTGAGLDQSSVTNSFQSLAVGFQLGQQDDNNNQTGWSQKAADIDVVGAATTAPLQMSGSSPNPAVGMLMIGVATRGNWARPVGNIAISVEVTTSANVKYLMQVEQPKVNNNWVDRYVVNTYRVSDNVLVDTEPLNGLEATTDTNVFDGSVAVLPVSLSALGFSNSSTATTITYKVTVEANGFKDSTDGTQPSLDVFKPDLWFGEVGKAAIYKDYPREMPIHRKSQSTTASVLVLHLHNTLATRVDVVDLPADSVTSVTKPTVVGALRRNATVTANPGTWSGASAFDLSYQWLRDGAVIGGATSQAYTITQADVDKQLSVRVTAVRGSQSAVAESARATVRLGTPAATEQPVLSGVPAVGGVLSATTGKWTDADPVGTYSYQWRRGGLVIAGETDHFYRVVPDDVGQVISVSVTTTRDSLTGESTSAGVTVVAAATPLVLARVSKSSQVYGTGGVSLTVSIPTEMSSVGGSLTVRDGGKTLLTRTVPAGITSVVVKLPATLTVGAHQLSAVYQMKSAVVAGAATSATSRAVALSVRKAKATVKVKIAKKTITTKTKLKVTVKVSAVGVNPTGTVWVKVGKKTVVKTTLKHGQRTLTLKRMAKGKKKITVIYRGSSTVLTATSKKAVVRVLSKR